MKAQKGFTLVELIVVVTIIAILGTMGLISLTNYTSKTRDAKRVSDIRTVYTGLSTLQAAGSKMPLPDTPTNILASGSLVGIQGTVGVNTTNAIHLNTPPKDPVDESNIIYLTDPSQTLFQLVGFFENSLTFDYFFPQETYAAGKEDRNIRSFGSELGVVLQANNAPVAGASYDIIANTTNPLKVIFSDSKSLSGTGTVLATANPRGSCQRIFASGLGKKDGTYMLSVLGEDIPVYCALKFSNENFYDYVVDGDFENPLASNWNSALKTTLTSKGNSTGLRVVGYQQLTANNFTYVDVRKKYTLAGKFRSAGAILSNIYYGFIEYDEDFNIIYPWHVSAVANTETITTKIIQPTDTSIEFANIGGSTCISWQNNVYFLLYASIAFNIDDSGSFSDLPNRNLSSQNGFSSITNNGTTCTLYLKSQIGKTFPIGTKIRMHSSGGTYNYVAASGNTVPATWTPYSGQVFTESLYGIDSTRFRRGTRFVKVLILANYQQTASSILEIDDLGLQVAN